MVLANGNRTLASLLIDELEIKYKIARMGANWDLSISFFRIGIERIYRAMFVWEILNYLFIYLDVGCKQGREL